MNKHLKLIVPAVLAAVALSACSSTGKTKAAEKPAAQPAQTQAAPQIPAPQTVKVDSIDSTKEVIYKCDKIDRLGVMYGIKDGQVVVAQLKVGNQESLGLFRVVGNNDQNYFWGNDGIIWASGAANAQNVDKVDGNALLRRGLTEVNGKVEVTDQIIARSCVLDKKATAALNKPAAKTKAKKK
ncbi:hypothetical protein ACOR62_04365 [Neisseria lisongii]|uniref:Lipoprotein n=1 Tax=Neisseria lisongii TaxID=2912188 RepID=A0AAW5AN20_9NEIS|nr:hypothetical protein [Neisseria lisongii]MCF7528659.1 hypothetical protein [Neisseria lisongii]MCF7529517.1 hypothetical protein [Neisseria lisongii]